MQDATREKTVLVLLPLSDAQKERLQAAAPRCRFEYTGGTAAAEEQIGRAHIIVGNIPPGLLGVAGKLEWLQTNSAGVDGYVQKDSYHNDIYQKDILLTSAAGAYGPAISEYMLAALLSLMKGLHIYRDRQNRRLWQPSGTVRTIEGSTALVVGMGGIGGAFARKLKALGAAVIGVKRTAGEKPPYADELYTADGLDGLLGRADIVSLSLPATKDTERIMTRDRLFAMKRGAYLLNVGRGRAVDTDALCEALLSGHLGGAALDVTDPEPLPPDHPLWGIENALITPHVSGGYSLPATLERIVAIAEENLRRYTRGEKLMNLVDFEAGY